MIPVLLAERVVLLCGDSKALDLGEGTVDAVVCDPPYELGFMGKKWDASGIAYDVDLWRAVFRALKPGGHLLAFGGTRTYHRMACAIEDAGFDIRDSLHWVYGSGFPKSLNVSKAIDESLGAERPIIGHASQLPGGNTFAQDAWSQANRAGGQTCVYLKAGKPCEGHDSGFSQGLTFHSGVTAPGSPEAERWSGWGTALKPAHEPIVLARKPLTGTVAANVLAHGTGGLNVDGCRIGSDDKLVRPSILRNDNQVLGTGLGAGTQVEPAGRWPANFVLSHADGCDEAEGFTVCRDGCPVAELDRQSGRTKSMPPEKGRKGKRPGGFANVGADCGDPAPNGPQYGDAGGASRFFYVAKPSARERDLGCEDMPERTGGQLTDRVDGSAGLSSPRAGAGRRGNRRNVHPTVKPIALMQWLCRLITPPGGVVLDPFCGSGTTGIAAVREGFSFIGIEQSPEYAEIAKARILRALSDTEKRKCK